MPAHTNDLCGTIYIFVIVMGCVSAQSPVVKTLYKQPRIAPEGGVGKSVYLNPSPWPRADRVNYTNMVMWQRSHPNATVVYPYNGSDVDAAVGVRADQTQRAASSATTPRSEVLYANGYFGAQLNTSGESEALSTITIESSFDSDGCALVWDGSNATELSVEMQFAAPIAFRQDPEDNGCAVYASLSIYLRSKTKKYFVWYSTPIFDFGRDVERDHVFIDTVSQKLIVSGPVSGRSRYNQRGEGSALTSNRTLSPDTLYSYRITAANVEAGIRDGLARFPGQLPPDLPLDASSWCVPGFNLELEATPGAGAGMRVSGMHISVVSKGSG